MTTATPKTLRLRHPRPEAAIEPARGVRPGVRSMEWFGETLYYSCHLHWTKSGSELVPSIGKCECGVAWKVGDATTAQPAEPCATCLRKAVREHAPLPSPVELFKLWICNYCGEAMCRDHVHFYGYGEDTHDVCRNCARARKLQTNRDFDADTRW